ncbi:hypothetical protein GH733_000964 [Mirounga leonina]|nr:hypothetical protein GH733_000964 [Mirounga leonina]
MQAAAGVGERTESERDGVGLREGGKRREGREEEQEEGDHRRGRSAGSHRYRGQRPPPPYCLRAPGSLPAHTPAPSLARCGGAAANAAEPRAELCSPTRDPNLDAAASILQGVGAATMLFSSLGDHLVGGILAQS